jgi:tetratricopeptide (TPR) repeat protein
VEARSDEPELPGATAQDRRRLEEVQSGADLKTLRRDILLTKIGPSDPELIDYSPNEQCKVAVYSLRAMYNLHPADAEITYALGHARYCAGQLDLAKPLLETVVANNPAHADALTILGLIARKSDKPDVDIEMYRRAIEADPQSALALVNLASRVMDEDPHRARQYLNTALKTMELDNPHRAVALHLMGNSHAHIEKDYPREAEFHRQAVRLAPENALFRDNLVQSLLSAGRPIDARRTCTFLLRRDFASLRVHAIRGWFTRADRQSGPAPSADESLEKAFTSSASRKTRLSDVLRAARVSC